MAENPTRTAVLTLYEAYKRGDTRRLAELIDDEVDWVLYGPIEVFPFMGRRQGKTGALGSLAGIAKDYVLDRYELEALIVEEDRAAVMADVAFTQRATGRVLRLKLADFLRFRDGRVIEFREFCDSFDAAEQTLGRWLDIAPSPSPQKPSA